MVDPIPDTGTAGAPPLNPVKMLPAPETVQIVPATPGADPIRHTGTAGTPPLEPGETPPAPDTIQTAPATPGADPNQPPAPLAADAGVSRDDQTLPPGLRIEPQDAERARQAADDIAPGTAPKHKPDDAFPASGALHVAGPGAGLWRDHMLRLPEDHLAARAAEPEPIVAHPRVPSGEE